MRRIALTLVTVALGALAAPASAQPEPRIVGGHESGPGAFPWQVALTDAIGAEFCGGTLISPTRVLTAGHCALHAPRSSITVVAGTGDLMHAGQRTGVTSIAVHPGYRADEYTGAIHNDVAVLEVQEPITISTARTLKAVVGSPSLDDGLWAPGAALTIVGWGALSEDQPSQLKPTRLHEAVVPRVDDAGCAASYGADFDPESMVCAGYEAGGVDTCRGDSGGPLMAPTVGSPDRANPDHWRLVGVTSWGDGCAQALAPGVYARLGSPSVRAFLAFPVEQPSNRTLPQLTGDPRAGATLTCQPGRWAGDAATLRYAFYRLPASGATILAAHGDANTYALSAADVGAVVACVVTARNEGGDAVAQSPVVGPVSAGAVQQRIARRADVAAPRALRLRRACTKARRCTVTVRIADAPPSSGVAEVRGRLSYRFGRRTRRRTIVGRRTRGTQYELRTGRLRPGRYTLRITAEDREGNEQLSPTVVRWRVR